MDIELNTLLNRVKAGDDTAFDSLCEKYASLTENTVRRFAPSLGVKNGIRQTEAAEDIEDIKQDAMMALFKAAQSYDPEGDGQKVSFGLYAKICMNNAMITKVRKYKRTLKKLQKRDSMTAHQHFEADTVSEKIDLAALSDTLKHAIEGLSDFERQVFERYIGGRTVRDIAAELDRSPKSVSNACYRVKAKLKEVLKR